MKTKSFNDLFENGLRYAYDTEQKLVEKGIPSMIEAANSTELRSALQQHLTETQQHVSRLEKVFGIIGAEPKTEDDDIIDEITNTAEKMISATDENSPLRDAVLIIGGGHVEHYEMAVYEGLSSIAKQLGYTEAVTLLEQTLKEEKAADEKLKQIGATSVNAQASQERRAA